MTALRKYGWWLLAGAADGLVHRWHRRTRRIDSTTALPRSVHHSVMQHAEFSPFSRRVSVPIAMRSHACGGPERESAAGTLFEDGSSGEVPSLVDGTKVLTIGG